MAQSLTPLEKVASLQGSEELLVKEIRRLKEQRNAVLLAHNYQIPQIQDIADFLGDSLGLSQEAARTDADVILFCGVRFMAETASILCPDKTVLLPDLGAGCSLSDMITAEELRTWKEKHPEAVVVCYVNSSAEVKAESDYCCTSANAVKVVNAVPRDKEVLFLPDIFLGAYVSVVTGRKLHLWPGECHVHSGITPERILKLRGTHPGAEFLIHPECGCVTSCMYYLAERDIPAGGTHILSTGGMIKRAKQSKAREFIVATETGIIHRLRKESPEKTFIPVSEDAVCRYMKMITLDKVYRSLRDMVYEVRVPEEIASRARKAIERMITIG